MKKLVMLWLLTGCLGGDGSGGSIGGGPNTLPVCPTQIMNGQICATEPACQWTEGIDAGAPAVHRCECDFGKWRCVTQLPEDDVPDEPPPPPIPVDSGTP